MARGCLALEPSLEELIFASGIFGLFRMITVQLSALEARCK